MVRLTKRTSKTQNWYKNSKRSFRQQLYNWLDLRGRAGRKWNGMWQGSCKSSLCLTSKLRTEMLRRYLARRQMGRKWNLYDSFRIWERLYRSVLRWIQRWKETREDEKLWAKQKGSACWCYWWPFHIRIWKWIEEIVVEQMDWRELLIFCHYFNLFINY